MRKQTFIQGAMILLAAGILNRILGFIPRIALPRIIGAEGIGLYQMGYPLLIVLITIVTGGIPLAVAKLVAEFESKGDHIRVKRILRSSLAITAGIGTFLSLACMAGAKWISTHVLTDERVYYTFLIMSPTILIISISAVLRGYFQGKQNMIPSAASQTVETIIRAAAVLIFAYIALPHGIEYAAAGAMMGVLIGEISGMLVLLITFWRQRSATKDIDKSAGFRHDLGRLAQISIPVTGSKLVGSGSYFLESVMIVQSLAYAGIAVHIATSQYGILQGMVMPLLLLPTALTYSLAVSLVPSLSEAAAQGNYRLIHLRMHQSLRLALVTGAPFVVIMFTLSEPLTQLLYNNAEAGIMLQMMAPAALFIYFQAPLNAALQALDKPGTALLNTFIGASVKLILIFLLAAKLKMGITGAVIASCINMAIVTLLHWFSVRKLLGLQLQLSDFTKVGAGMIIMGIFCVIWMQQAVFFPEALRFISACAIGAAAYFGWMIAAKVIDQNDLVRIPWIGRWFL